jgi:uncharacterized protein YceK
MKQILTFFIVVLLVGGCQSSPINISSTPSGVTTTHEGRQGVSPEEKQFGDSNSSQKALVIGNADYEYSALQNPVNDAKAMTDSLVNLGFHVTRATNFDDRRMKEVIQNFKNNLPQNG